jgi:hypothetical protein
MTLRATAFAALALFLIASASSASTVRLSIGDRVRVTARSIDAKPMVGRVVYGDPLQVTIALDDGTADSAATTRGIGWESINALERSDGQRSRVKTGLAAGGIAGFAGSVAVLALNDTGTSDLGGGAALGGILLCSAAGAAVGAGIGSLIHTERWTPLPLDSRVGLQLGASSLPFAVGLRVDF